MAAIFWTYAGYPCLLAVLARVSTTAVASRAPIEPTVTVIISAYNEQKDIGQKLANTLALDYPQEKLEVIVASDCSTDRTHEIVEQFRDRSASWSSCLSGAARPPLRTPAASAGDAARSWSSPTPRPSFSPTRSANWSRGSADPRVGCVDAPN